MMFSKSRFLFYVLVLCFWISQGQDRVADITSPTEFEVLTGKTPYQLMYYFLNKSDIDPDATKKEIQFFSDKIMVGGSVVAKAEWLYIKVRLTFFVYGRDAYKTALENYNIFVINNPGDYPYLAKQKSIQAYLNFFSGTWAKSIALYEEALLLANEENDMLIAMDSRKQIAYISTFSGDQEAALQKLKNVFYELDNNANRYSKIKKDIPLLKIKTLELICRFYELNRAIEVDSLSKYSHFYQNKIRDVKDSLEYTRMYIVSAYTAVLQNKIDKAEQYVDSVKMKNIGVINKYNFMNLVQSEIYYNKKKYKEGIALREVFGDADSISDTRHSFSKYDFKFLAKSYKMLGDYERSNYYYDHFERANNRLDKIMDSVSVSIRKREVAEFKKELEALKVEKTSQDSILKYLVLTGSLVILVLLIALFRFYRSKNKREEQFLLLLEQVAQAENSKEVLLQDKTESLEKKTNSSSLNEDTVASILEGLQKLEDQYFFLKQECNTYTMAKKLKTNTSYLSKVINTEYNKNFNTYINDLRIEYVLVKLKSDSRFRAYSIQGIAEELGYKSADSFTKYFKQHTGLLPSFYIKKLNSIE